MTLVLEVEYLSGICFAALSPDSETVEWPPEPDRVFSALVATWASRGENSNEGDALQWLERLDPPLVDASAAESRSAPVTFVPPNDPRSDKASVSVMMPEVRRRQPRRFPSARPHNPVVKLIWNSVDIDERTLEELQKVAFDVAYVGHSASLTRCRFVVLDTPVEMGKLASPGRRVYPGRLDELRREFAAGRRPQPGAPVRIEIVESTCHESVFGGRWLILEDVGEEMPDIRACALVARSIRDTILSGYQRSGMGDRVPEVVSGHTPDGKPTRELHLAIIPLPFAGFPYADGHIMAFAVVPPRTSRILDDSDFRSALRQVAELDENRGRRIMSIKPRAGTSTGQPFSIALSPTFEPPPNKRSLDPVLYNLASSAFATVTPIILDRHLKEKGAARAKEIAELVATACRNIGLPEPKRVVADKHAALEGVPSAYPSGNAPAWTRWSVPSTFNSRQLTHAYIEFNEPVAGPVILGSGRYLGLGLCRPVSSMHRSRDDVVR